jgi:predicted O-methyltransferase YrrM
MFFLQASVYDTDAFDPESTNFSKRSTLNTWVAPKYKEDEGSMKKLQRCVAMTVTQNPYFYNFVLSVPSPDGERVDYGKTFYTIPSIELPFLQYVAGLTDPITVEFGAAIGLVSWKLTWALRGNGRHIANDISRAALEQFTAAKGALESFGADKSVVEVDCGDVFGFLNRHPGLKGKVNAVFMQNVEHFFNPCQHQNFLRLLSELLADGGQAFLCSQSFMFGEDATHPMRVLYNQRKEAGDTYPGFCCYTVRFCQYSGSPNLIPGSDTCENVYRPEDSVPYQKTSSKPEIVGKEFNKFSGKLCDVVSGCQKIVGNHFSPSVYRAALSMHPELEVMQTFFINRSGEIEESWGQRVSHAAAIIKKR